MTATTEVLSGFAGHGRIERNESRVDWENVALKVVRFLTVRSSATDQLFDIRDHYFCSPHRIPFFGE